MTDDEQMMGAAQQPPHPKPTSQTTVVGRHPLPTWIRRLDAASAGQGLLLLTTLLVLATLPLLGRHSSDWPAALLVDAGMGAVLALSLFLPWRSWPKSATLFYPAVTLIGLAALGLGLDR